MVDRHRKVFPPHGPRMTLESQKLSVLHSRYKIDVYLSLYGLRELRHLCAGKLGIYQAVSI